MLEAIILAVPLAFTWMVVTAKFSLDSFLVGFVSAAHYDISKRAIWSVKICFWFCSFLIFISCIKHTAK